MDREYERESLERAIEDDYDEYDPYYDDPQYGTEEDRW